MHPSARRWVLNVTSEGPRSKIQYFVGMIEETRRANGLPYTVASVLAWLALTRVLPRGTAIRVPDGYTDSEVTSSPALKEDSKSVAFANCGQGWMFVWGPCGRPASF